MAEKVTFFLSPPRCRTAWLSLYLTGMGVYCYHELWRDVQTIEEFAKVIAAQKGAVANADPSNWLFVQELQTAFPEAQFIVLTRSAHATCEALDRTYGDGDYLTLFAAYTKAMEADVPVMQMVNFEAWTPDTSQALWAACCLEGTPFNTEWHEHMHKVQVQITEARIIEDRHLAVNGQIRHIQEKIAELSGRALWV